MRNLIPIQTFTASTCNIAHPGLLISHSNNPTNQQINESTNQRINIMTEKLYDTELIRQMSRGNPNFIRQMLLVFSEDAPKNLIKIRQGIQEADHEAIRKQAHSLKSSVDLLHIDKSKTLVRQIEEYAREKAALEKIESLFLAMEANISEVIETIHRDVTS